MIAFWYYLEMTYDQLAAFLAVVTTGTFGGAAGALHKSQPAVSKLVKNLEEALGVLLLDRSSYRPTLTDAGQLFFERAIAVVEDTDALAAFGRALGGATEAIIRIVLEAVTPLPPVLAALADVKAQYPAVRYELRTERMGGALEALEDGSADLVIAHRHAGRAVPARSTDARSFWTVRILAVVAADHPLAALRGPIPPGVLREHPQVVLRESGRGPLDTNVNILEGGLRWTVTDVQAKRDIIGASMGWGGLPEHLVADDLTAGRLVALEVPAFDVETIELRLLRRRTRSTGPVSRALWAALVRQAGGPTTAPPV